MDYSEECRSYILPPAEEVDLYTEDTGCLDQRWGPLNDEDISLFLRRINFKEIIALHTKNIKHTLQKCESVSVYRITSHPEIKPYHTIPIHLNGILLRTFIMVCKKSSYNGA